MGEAAGLADAEVEISVLVAQRQQHPLGGCHFSSLGLFGWGVGKVLLRFFLNYGWLTSGRRTPRTTDRRTRRTRRPVVRQRPPRRVRLILLETAERQQLAYVEGHRGGYFVRDQPDLGDLIGKYGILRAQALTPEESAKLIERVAQTL